MAIIMFRNTPSLQDGSRVYDLPVVETTGFITLSLWGKDNLTIQNLLVVKPVRALFGLYFI